MLAVERHALPAMHPPGPRGHNPTRTGCRKDGPLVSMNPFFEPSTLPYQLPPFAEIREEHYAPALERAMAERLEEIAAIAADPAAPTFLNTIVALELAGQLLRRVVMVFQNQGD